MVQVDGVRFGRRRRRAVGFVRPQHRGIILDDTTIEGLLDKMAAFQPVTSIVQIKGRIPDDIAALKA